MSAVQFLYNKTSLQLLEKNLMIRLRAIPTIRNREAALRMELKKIQQEIVAKEMELHQIRERYKSMHILWKEMDVSLLRVDFISTVLKKTVGVNFPSIEGLSFRVEEFSSFNSPLWFNQGLEVLKSLVTVEVELVFLRQKLELFDIARKKTTRKLNLFEKVQIPAFQEGIARIKRFLEDEENLSKAAKKIMKVRLQES